MKRRAEARWRCVATVAIAAMVAMVTGCTEMTRNETTGTLLGGAAGALLGSQFGKGDGAKAMTAIGAIVGASVGRNIGASLDATSQQRVVQASQQALDNAPVGQRIMWDNPANEGGAAHGYVEVRRQGTDGAGRRCREFQQVIVVGGQETNAYGTACKDANGDWQVVASESH